ncbi:MAG: hypothetical protein GYA23_06655 [Methanomicrobiales archaeon]|nr:hypothetical protein [Methanomicrobiales archaeon]
MEFSPAGFSRLAVFICPYRQWEISDTTSGLVIPVSGSETAPLARLVLFMFSLAIAGSVVAGVHYVAIDLPAQKSLQLQPENSGSCTLIYSGGCTMIRNSICSVRGTDIDWLYACMKENGCCV